MFYQFYFCIKHKGETQPRNTRLWPQGKGLIKLPESKNIQICLLSCLQQLSMLFHTAHWYRLPQLQTVRRAGQWLTRPKQFSAVPSFQSEIYGWADHTAPAMVALISESKLFITSDCKLQVMGSMRFTLRSLEAVHASSSIALWHCTQQQGPPPVHGLWCKSSSVCGCPALCEWGTALALASAFPLSFPALPPTMVSGVRCPVLSHATALEACSST